jgi:hypothetical protein
MVRPSRADVLFGLVIVLIAVALGISVASLGRDLRPLPLIEKPEAARTEGASERQQSAQGYSFGYPAGWRARNAGAVTKVSSPRRRIVVSVGPGPAGPLRRAARSFIALIRRQYEDVRVSRRATVRLGARTAFVSSGTATTKRGFRVRMIALALADGTSPYLIAGFSDAHVVPTNLEERVMAIARSLRRSEPP